MKMVCGGFVCSKNALAALNILYILVAFILIAVAGYFRAASIITNIAVVGGIVACGVFLLLLAIVGLIGAIKHHQVLLFFYMVILFLLFLVQFAVACACLAISPKQQKELANQSWDKASVKLKNKTQTFLDCCGFDEKKKGLSCENLKCCKNQTVNHKPDYCNGNSTSVEDKNACQTCWDASKDKISKGLKVVGGVGMFFSFTEFLGVWLTVRFRNLKDPRANPSAFL